MRCVVTGAAGFIGSHLVDALLASGHEVLGVDNLSTGRREFLAKALASPRFQLELRDLKDPLALEGLLGPDTDWVFHLAANADVRHGFRQPHKDFEENTRVTFLVLEAMRRQGARRIAFSSTGSVYGETGMVPTPEDCPFPVQTSLYGASKLACEGMLQAYAVGYGMEAAIFRFVSILGERYTHGHVLDFATQLRQDPTLLRILGDGSQRKSYLYVGDCVAALLLKAGQPFAPGSQVYNLGNDEAMEVNRSVDLICTELGVWPRREYSGGDRGWIGDNPLILLDCRKMRLLGWRPRVSIDAAVRITARDVQQRLAQGSLAQPAAAALTPAALGVGAGAGAPA